MLFERDLSLDIETRVFITLLSEYKIWFGGLDKKIEP
jgi:hypothetical protein